MHGQARENGWIRSKHTRLNHVLHPIKSCRTKYEADFCSSITLSSTDPMGLMKSRTFRPPSKSKRVDREVRDDSSLSISMPTISSQNSCLEPSSINSWSSIVRYSSSKGWTLPWLLLCRSLLNCLHGLIPILPNPLIKLHAMNAHWKRCWE